MTAQNTLPAKPMPSIARPPTNDVLHGVTLKMILTELVRRYGWDNLGRQIDIRCFNHEPSIPSSLKFLRRTPWARQQVESLYVRMVQQNPDQALP